MSDATGPDLATLALRLDGAEMERQTKSLGQTMAELGTRSTGLTSAQKMLQERIDQVAAAVENLDRSNKQSVAAVQKQIEENQKLGVTFEATADQMAQLVAVEAQLTASRKQITDSTRGMTLMQIEAIRMNEELANSSTKAGIASAGHGLQLGRLRMELGTLVGRLTGTNTALDRMGGAIAAMGTGDVAVIAALAGIAAIAYGIKTLGGEAAKAKEETAKLIEELEKKFKLERQGGNPQVIETALQQRIKSAQDLAAFLQTQIDRGGSSALQSAAQADRSDIALGDAPARIAKLKTQRDQQIAIEREARRQLDELRKGQNEDAVRSYTDNLAAFQSAGRLSDTARAAALQNIKEWQAQVAAILAKNPDDNAAVPILKRIEEAQKALEGKKNPADNWLANALGKDKANYADQVTAIIAETQAIKDQADAYLNGQAALNAYLVTQAGAIEVAKKEKEIRDLQAQAAEKHVTISDAEIARIRQEGAELARLAQQREVARQATENERAAQETIQQQAERVAGITDQTEALKAEAEAMLLGERDRQVLLVNKREDLALTKAQTQAERDAINARREQELRIVAITVSQKEQADATKKAASEQQQILKQAANDIQRTFATLFDDILTHGLDSFGQFWDAVKKGAIKTVADIAAADLMSAIRPQISSVISSVLGGGSGGGSGGASGGGAIPNSALGLSGASAAAWMLPAAGAALAIGSIVSSLHAQEVEAHAAYVQFEQTRVSWNTSLDAFVKGFDTSYTQFQKAQDAAVAQMSASTNAAIHNAYVGVQGQTPTLANPATRHAEDVLLQQLGGLSRNAQDLPATIAKVQALQGSGVNVAMDNILRQLLADLKKQYTDDAGVLKALADQQAAAKDAFTADLTARKLQAEGLTDAAQIARDAKTAEDQLTAARQAGYDAATLATLAEVQKAEVEQRASDAAIAAAQKQEQAAAAQLATAQKVFDANQGVATSLRAYADSLVTANGSPEDQLAAARSQFDALAAKARAGDQTAAGQLAGAAGTFLTDSKGYNASGAGYASDSAYVQSTVTAVAQQYADVATTEQQILDAIKAEHDLFQQQLLSAQQAADKAHEDAQAQLDALNLQNAVSSGDAASIIAALNQWRGDAVGPADALVTTLQGLRDGLDLTGQRIVDAQMLSLLDNRNALSDAIAAEIAAVQAGASAQVIAQDQAIAVLERQRLQANEDALRQEALLIASGHVTDAQLADLEAMRLANDAAYEEQIAHLKDIAKNTGDTVHTLTGGTGGTGTGGGTGGSGGGTDEILQQLAAVVTAINVFGATLVPLSQAGFTGVMDGLTILKQSVEDQTLENRRGFESLALSHNA